MKAIYFIILFMFIIVGCTPVEDADKEYTTTDFAQVLEQKNPELCLNFNDEIVDETFANKYVNNIEKVDDEILFKDLCLIYTISIVEHPDQNTVIKPNLNDKFILLCNEASDRICKLKEEGSYNVPAWEFCFRHAFGDYKSYPQPPRFGDINNLETCNKLKGFKDDCLWLVAKNNKDASICDLMSNEARIKICKEEFG